MQQRGCVGFMHCMSVSQGVTHSQSLPPGPPHWQCAPSAQLGFAGLHIGAPPPAPPAPTAPPAPPADADEPVAVVLDAPPVPLVDEAEVVEPPVPEVALDDDDDPPLLPQANANANNEGNKIKPRRSVFM